MNEFDRENATGALGLAQRAALPVGDPATVIPVEAGQLERLAVHLFDFDERHADANAVRVGPGRLILRPDHRRPAPQFLIAPDEFQPRLGVVRIEHAGLCLLPRGAIDLAVDDVGAEGLHQVGMARISAERPLARDHTRGCLLPPCHRGHREQSRDHSDRCGRRFHRIGHPARSRHKSETPRWGRAIYRLSAAVTSFTASSLAHSAGPATVPISQPAGSTRSVVGIPAARPTILRS
jgi:hypothetical protein